MVSTTLLVLSVFGFVIDSLRDKIPPPEPNRLRFENQEYLVQGARSRVDWRPLSPDVFSVARRSGKPIMLAIGAPWSKIGRDADTFVFSDKDVVSFLNRYMICVRIDSQAEPHWLSAILPVRRLQVPMTPGFQIWFLTPEGEVFDNGGEAGTLSPLDSYTFTGILVRARERLRLIRAGGPEAPTPGDSQREDHDYITEPSFPVGFDPEPLETAIQAADGLSLGGTLQFRRVKPMANAVQFLDMTGQREAAQKAIVSLLKSPLPDWLDGGVYRSYTPTAPHTLEYDKSSLSNAEWMSVLAKFGGHTPDPTIRSFAEDIFDMLTHPDFVIGGFVAGCQVGDESTLARSRRNSFTPMMLREALTPEEREVARKELGLRVESNRVMSVWMRHPPLAYEPSSRVGEVIAKLRASRKGTASFAGRRQLDIHGYVTARLLECARLWNDPARLMRADDLYSRLDWFLAGDDVKHTLESGIPDTPFLGDYLAYADATLQHFLAFGRVDSLRKGVRVLKRAMVLFESETPGVWRTAIPAQSVLGPKDTDVPEVLDFLRESCTAMAIRLCNSYGRLLRDDDAPVDSAQNDGLLFLQAAQSTVGQNSAVARTIGIEGAGLYCATLRVRDDRHAFVVGPSSVAIAQRLARRVSHRLVAPALGPVRPVLQDSKPGIYVVLNGKVEGPMSEAQAVDILGRPFGR